MPLALQVKLLRVLQDGVLERLGSNQPIRVNCRVVAAAKGDMLYRLNVVTVALRPLAERREDIVPLFEHFMLDAAVRYSRPAALQQREWPGNVRELRNAADRFVLGVTEGLDAAADEAAPDDAGGPALKARVEQFERAVIAQAWGEAGGAVADAADRLQVGKATLYEKMKRYCLSARGETER